jgi:hypothetical protein
MLVNEDYTLVIRLDSATLDAEDVTVGVKAPNSDFFEQIEVSEDNFEYADYNYYNIVIPKDLICETGTYVFAVEGYETEYFETRECLPKPYSSSPPADTCIVTGNIRDISGRAQVYENVDVTVYPVKLPLTISSNLTLGQRVIARTDFDGYFSIPVIRGAEVRFEIKKAGVRFQAIIPDEDTIEITELIP